MTSAFDKDTWRSIRHTLGRFLAIFGIVALGAGFYAGLRMSGEDMRLGLDAYADESSLFDVELISTLGFSEADVQAVLGVDGVESVMPAHSTDVIIESGIDKTHYNVDINSLDLSQSGVEANGTAYLNQLTVTEGRLPRASGECVLGESFVHHDIALGDTITIVDGVTDVADTFATLTYTVVGFVRSAAFVSTSVGSTSLGDGILDRWMYIPTQDFASDVYTELYLTVEGAPALLAPESDYDELVDKTQTALEALAPERARARLAEVKAEAQKSVDEGQAELEEAREQLDSGESELAGARASIESGKAQLVDAQSRYESGVASHNTAKADADAAITGAEQVNTALAGLNSVFAPLGLVVDLDNLATYVAAASDTTDPLYPYLNPYAAQLTQLGQTADTLKSNGLVVTSGAFDIAASRAYLDTQLAEAQARLDAAWADIQNGWASIAGNEATVANGESELADARARIAEAEQDIAEAQAQIDDIETPTWYVIDRHKNVGFESFYLDSKRIDSIALIFPLIFLLVAALVCLTTMTRMVEDERMTIGTFKALGYGKGRIISKYLTYAGVASVAGSIVGILICSKLLPSVIFTAYTTMYLIPSCIYYPIDVGLALLGAGLTIGITLVATYAAARATLRETPASLMLPRAPKMGKRILLERIKPLWRRLSFMWKVTARNIFRYKKRLWMTVVGIAGCTALLLTGFGIKDSINDMLEAQFGTIYRYNISVGLDTEKIRESEEADGAGATATAREQRSYRDDGSDMSTDVDGYLGSDIGEVVQDDGYFSDYLLVLNQNVVVGTTDLGEDGISTHLIVPQDTSRLNDMITLRNRKHRETELIMDDESVIVSEKLARELGVEVGDQIELAKTDLSGQPSATRSLLTVTAITENYLYHYLYISPALYATILDKEPAEYNELLGIAVNDATLRHEIDTALGAADRTTTVAYNDELVGNFDSMLASLNSVTWVLIIAAAALAFIVLYNLSNINITERQREIASLKVLGFTDREVDIYIYREIVLLTLLGCVLGLVAGVFLCHWITTTAEVEMTMFYRDMRPLSFVLSFLLTLLFSFIVNLFTNRKLKRIDMVESLKSVE